MALQEAKEAGLDAAAAAAAAEDAVRATLRSGGGASAAPAPCLASLEPYEVERLGASGAEFRGLLRIKVEDCADIQTARQALAESGYFLTRLRKEAPERGLTDAELLKKCDLGEADP